jgi:membrane associated rhomboid family serine protease
MLFPLSDDDRSLASPAYVTWALVAANLAAFAVQWNDPGFTYRYALVPYEITHGEDLVQPVALDLGSGQYAAIPHAPGPRPLLLTLFTSMFLHGGLAHLGGNLLFLWIFGDNVEHRFGHLAFLLFYLASGIAAGCAQIAVDPQAVLPMLGASGAISGVMGAYLVLFPHNRVHVIVLIWIVSLPAYVVIGLWVLSQFSNGLGSIAVTAPTGGVAYAAHLGGFAAGAAIALFCRSRWLAETDSVFSRAYLLEAARRSGR